MTALVPSVLAQPASADPPVPTVTRISPRQLIDTATGLGGYLGRMHPGQSLEAALFGHLGVPGTGASSVLLRVRLSDAYASGHVDLYHQNEDDPHTHVVPFTARSITDQLITVPLGQDGRLVVNDDSAAYVDAHIWVFGYTAYPGGDEWLHAYGSAGRGDSNPGANAFTTASLQHLQRRWSGVGAATPVITATTIFRATYEWHDDHEIYGVRAVSVATGASQWAVWNVPSQRLALYGHVLYVAGGSLGRTEVSAVSLSTHTVMWTRPVSPDGSGYLWGFAVDSGQVYASTDSGRFGAWDAGTGALLWSRTVPVYTGVVADTARVVLGFQVLDGRTGAMRWSATTGQGAPTVADDRVFWTDGAHVYGYGLGGCGHLTCSPAWTTATGLSATSQANGEDTRLSLAADADTVVFEGAAEGNSVDTSRVTVFDAGTGHVRSAVSFDTAADGLAVYIAGPTILVPYGVELYAMPVSCTGTCTSLVPVLHFDGWVANSLKQLAVAGHTLAVQGDADSGALVVYTVT